MGDSYDEEAWLRHRLSLFSEVVSRCDTFVDGRDAISRLVLMRYLCIASKNQPIDHSDVHSFNDAYTMFVLILTLGLHGLEEDTVSL
jgi:hypothetical protein